MAVICKNLIKKIKLASYDCINKYGRFPYVTIDIDFEISPLDLVRDNDTKRQPFRRGCPLSNFVYNFSLSLDTEEIFF